ncbi:MAG TPA: PIG-L deacetylase family protein [Methylomirabilota bacterium]|jgi:LmbE family N-acetylglucosaminyl deacetylase|nr:PIG-L deacetylase family protein [Methylomirabilota bacterium]
MPAADAPAPPEIWSAPPAGRVLVLAPHPDDETIGCGGILALHRAQGDPVRVVFLTDGGAGDPAGHYPAERYVAIRQAEARRACGVLGVTDLEFWAYPDGKLGTVAELSERLLAALGGFTPKTVYSPSSRELHPDHGAAGARVEALHRARRLGAAIYAYEIWAAIEPTHVIDVSAVVEQKLAALAEYPSQLRYNDYRPKMLGLNTYRTLTLPPGARYAEAFRRLA